MQKNVKVKKKKSKANKEENVKREGKQIKKF